jgi:CO/xanthine dehydrogenase Mo-binding subunit
MSTRTFGEPIKRNEDRRLLTGRALFIDDVELPGMLHAAFLRSQVAHARILNIDVSRALRRPGVIAAYVAGDLGDYWRPGPLLVPPPQSQASSSTSAPRFRSPGTRSAMSANPLSS